MLPVRSTTAPRPAPTPPPPPVSLRDAAAGYGSRVLWSGVDLDIAAGEFIAVLGPNGAGKSTLLKVLLGEVALREGTVRVAGREVRRGSAAIGYVPQQGTIADVTGLRGRDLVALGLDGHRWGIGVPTRRRREAVRRALDLVGAGGFADVPLSMLSGGERQRLRIAQALVTRPEVLLCDEPLLSLDLQHQRIVADLIGETRVRENMAVVFVTHEINPILPMVDRVVYLVGGRARVGTPEEVMRTDVLSELYGSPVEVWRHRDRYVVIGGEHVPHHHHHDDREEEPTGFPEVKRISQP